MKCNRSPYFLHISNCLRNSVTFFFVFAMVLSSSLLPSHAYAQNTDSDECVKLTRDSVDKKIQGIINDKLTESINNVKIPSIVQRHWLNVGISTILDQEVNSAIDRMYEETNYFERLWSNWWPGKAEEFARDIAANVFQSPRYSQAIDKVTQLTSDEIANKLVKEIDQAVVISKNCLYNYINGEYSSTLLLAFDREINL